MPLRLRSDLHRRETDRCAASDVGGRGSSLGLFSKIHPAFFLASAAGLVEVETRGNLDF